MQHCFLVCFVILTAVPLLVNGQQEIHQCKIGIENCYKNGLWTPVHISSSGCPDGSKIIVRCSDADGTPIDYCGTITHDQATIYAKLGREKQPIEVILPEFHTTKNFNVPVPVRSEKPIYLIIGNDDIGLQGAVAELSLHNDRRPLLVRVNSASELPEHWYGYDAVTMIVLTTTDTKFFESLTSESPQIQAMNTWLTLGGTMLFAAGSGSKQLLEPKNGALRPFLPGKFSKMTELRQGTAFENYINSKRPIYMTGTQDAPFLQMPYITDTTGITFVKDGDCPLVLRTAHGFGTLIYFGGDLSGKPLGGWRDRVKLVSQVLQWNTSVEKRRADSANASSSSILQLGYNDISGQIRSALDRHSGVRNVPFSVILIVLTAYWLFIGIVDWFVVRKLLNRPMLTWLTFPLWIVLFSVLAYGLTAWTHPVQCIVNELHVIDADSETGLRRSNTWLNLYTANDALYSVSVSGKTGAVSYFGLPGSGFGGMAPKTVSPNVWNTGAVQPNSGELDAVPVQIRSTKSFFAQTIGNVAACIGSTLADEEGVPVGTLTVPENMPVLENVLLIYGRWALELGNIEPKQTITLDKKTPRQEMRSLLSAQKVQDNAALRQLMVYESQSDNLEYIVRAMTLHHILGGYESIGLYNTFQNSQDFSGLLTADRVILLGKVKSSGTADLRGDIAIKSATSYQTFSTAVFRQALPIKLTELSPRLKIERQYFKPDDLEQKINPARTDGNSGWSLEP